MVLHSKQSDKKKSNESNRPALSIAMNNYVSERSCLSRMKEEDEEGTVRIQDPLSSAPFPFCASSQEDLHSASKSDLSQLREEMLLR